MADTSDHYHDAGADTLASTAAVAPSLPASQGKKGEEGGDGGGLPSRHPSHVTICLPSGGGGGGLGAVTSPRKSLVAGSRLTPRVRIRIEEYTPSPRTSGTITRKTVPEWIVAQGEVQYYESIKRMLDDIWMHRHADAQLPIVECCYDPLHDEFYLCQDRAALVRKFETMRAVGEARTVTRDQLSARLRRRGDNILALFFNCMSILAKAKRTCYIAREEVDVTPYGPSPTFVFRSLYDLLVPPTARRLVFYTLICNPMEQRLRKHMIRLARQMRGLPVPFDAAAATAMSDVASMGTGTEDYSSMDEIDLNDGDDYAV